MINPAVSSANAVSPDVLHVCDLPFAVLADLLARYDLLLQHVAAGEKIPGSYWGEP